jgi:hypothetical protein
MPVTWGLAIRSEGHELIQSAAHTKDSFRASRDRARQRSAPEFGSSPRLTAESRFSNRRSDIPTAIAKRNRSSFVFSFIFKLLATILAKFVVSMAGCAGSN